MARDEAGDMVRRMWLQALITQRFTTHSHAEMLYRAACKLCNVGRSERRLFVDFLSEAQDKLNSLGFDIKQCVDQHTRQAMLAVVSRSLRQMGSSWLNANSTFPLPLSLSAYR